MSGSLYLDLTIHTTATTAKVARMLRRRGLATWRVESMGYDCFYGWGEGKDPAGCIDHTYVSCHDLSDEEVQEIARDLVALGHQVVVTTQADWSKRAQPNYFPTVYHAEHQH